MPSLLPAVCAHCCQSAEGGTPPPVSTTPCCTLPPESQVSHPRAAHPHSSDSWLCRGEWAGAAEQECDVLSETCTVRLESWRITSLKCKNLLHCSSPCRLGPCGNTCDTMSCHCGSSAAAGGGLWKGEFRCVVTIKVSTGRSQALHRLQRACMPL